MNEKKLHVKTAVIVMSLVIFAVIATGIASAQIAPPTVSKSAAPTTINIAGSGVNEETTITITVTGTGSTTTTTVPMDVVFALDSSGSMSWNDPGGLRKTAAKDFVDKMDSLKDQAGVVSWDSNIDFTQALTNNFPLVKSKINAVDSSGGTNLDVGLTSAIGLLDTGKQGGASWVIIFLSDGQGTYHHSTAVTAANKGYTVYTIGLSMSSGSTAENNLKDIASTTGGKYYSSPSAANLDAIFKDIYKEVVTSTIPHYVDVVEVTQSYIIGEGSFNIAPSSVSTVGGITTIIWNNIGMGDGNPDLSADETVTLSFTAKSSKSGENLDVDVFGAAKVNYDDKDGNYAGSVNIPQAKINVNTPPLADAGPDQTVEQTYYQGADVNLDGSGSSDPDGDPLTYSWTWGGGSAIGVSPTVSLPLGTTTITLTVSDGMLTDTDTVVVNVMDTTPPVITCPADVTVEQENAAGTWVPLTATATDICDADVDITSDAPAIFPLGTTTVTFTATDDSGNNASCSMTVTVEDTTPPIITCPADITVEQKTAAGTVVPLTATATDICDADPTITSDELAIYPLGTTKVTFTATDDAGNNASCSMTVTVVDTTSPVVNAGLVPVCEEDDDECEDDDEGLFKIEFDASDICDADPEVSATICCARTCKSVTNGQLVEIEFEDDECEFEYEDGILEIEGPKGKIVLKVTATDDSGNVGYAEAYPPIVPEDEDDDEEEEEEEEED